MEGLYFIGQEKILSDYNLPPLWIVAVEGMWGLCACMVALPIMQSVECDDYNELGQRTFCNFGYWENSAFALVQLRANWTIILIAIASVMVIGPFAAFGLALTKYGSATKRVTVT